MTITTSMQKAHINSCGNKLDKDHATE